ncbi:SDR family NAD(P)-dependent oxidoreductase, partial [Streptomyces sp. NPDC002640]
ARGRLMQALPPGGAMLAVQAGEDVVGPLLEGVEERVSLAAVNGPASVVVSGAADAVAQVASQLTGQGVRTRGLVVSHAFHSPLMEPMLAEFRTVAEGVTFRTPVITLVSTLTGEVASVEELSSPDYWVSHARRAVRFHDAVRALQGLGVSRFVEIGPDATLTALTRTALGDDAVCVPSVRKDRAEDVAVLHAVGGLFVTTDTAIDWQAVHGPDARIVDLPTYPFQRERYWLDGTGQVTDVASAGLGDAGHPLLGAAVELPDTGGLVFTGRLSLHSHPWLADHAVAGTVILPGAAFVELALHAARHACCERVEELTLEAPLHIPAGEAVQLRITVDAADASGGRSVAVHTRIEGGGAVDDLLDERAWVRHATGTVVPDSAETARTAAAWEVWPPEGAEPVDPEELAGLYGRLADEGYQYGPVFQGLTAAWRRGDDVFAEVSMPEQGVRRVGDSAAPGRFGLHPALLDAALHSMGFGEFLDGGARLPFSWNDVELYATGASTLRVHLASAGPDQVTMRLADATGAPVAAIGSLTLRPIAVEQLTAARTPAVDGLFAVDWTPVAAAGGSRGDEVTRVIVGADPYGLAAEGTPVYADLAALLAAGAPRTPDAVLVFLGGDGEAVREAADAPGEIRALTAAGLDLVQRWLEADTLAAARLVVVTEGVVVARPGERIDGLAGAALHGLLRSAASEHPGRIAVVDVDGREESLRALPAAVAAISAGVTDTELAVREGTLYAPGLVRAGAGASDQVLVPPSGTGAWRLDVTAKGTLDHLALVPCPEATGTLEAGQIRIAVRAAGLNFRDVLIALGVYPGDALIGSEAAGVVTEVGPGVTGFAPGDRVLGLFPGGAGPVAVTDHRLAAPVPAGWTYAQAAVVPVVFLTAYYGLRDLAEVRPGQRLLVHAAAGGVGTAAVQLARHWGLEVFGTASPGKWDTLRGLGLDHAHIASSRTLDFERAFMGATDGAGMDVVLDSLAHEFVDASLRLLPRGGRFLEMGKTDIRDPQAVADDHPGVRYTAFDLHADAGADRIQRMLTDLMDLFARGIITPPPVTVWDVRQAPEAFRFFSQARHVGKIALTVPTAPDPDGTILVTGGTGSLGALVARHLVTEHGARRLLLASRRGPDAPGAADLRHELEALGATISVAACDITDADAIRALLEKIPQDHPLTSVVHTAGVLDDGTVESLTPERLDSVLRPKADAAWILHQLTRERGDDLAEFILFSSVSATLGGAGQANYAAANASLDALAAHRHAQGLPATSLAWGLWHQAGGMTGQLDDADLARIRRGGLVTIESARGLSLYDAARAAERPALVPAPLDLAVLSALADVQDLPTLFRRLVRKPVRRAAAGGARADRTSLRERLSGLPADERRRLLLGLVRDQVAAVLGHSSPDALDLDRSFRESGFDSLTAVELRNRVNTATGLRLPATLVFDHPTPAALAEQLHSLLAPEEPEAEDTTGHTALLAELDRLEAALASLGGRTGTDDDLHATVAARMQNLLTTWNQQRTGSAAQQDDTSRIASATSDEIFDFIDKELGRTSNH